MGLKELGEKLDDAIDGARERIEGIVNRPSLEDALKRMDQLQGLLEPERRHDLADVILCDVLDDLGYGELVAKWRIISWRG